MRALISATFVATAFMIPVYAEDVLLLQDLIAETLDRNPEIRAAQKRYEAARQRPSQESSLPDPVLMPSYMSTGSPLPGAGLGRETFSNLGITASQDIPFPGKRRLRGDIALKEAEAEFQQFQGVQLGVLSRLKQAYYRLRHSYAALDVMNRGKELLSQFLRIAEARYTVGRAAQQDLFKAQTQLSIIATRIERMQQEQRSAQVEINSILNRRPGAPLGVPPTHERPADLEVSADELLDQAARRAPTLRREQKMIERSELAVNLARRNLFPDFNVSAGYFNMGGMPDFYQVQVGIQLPLYAARKQRPAIHEQVHRLNEARRNFEAADQNLQFRVRDAYLLARTAHRLMNLYIDSVIPQSTHALESSLASYETGGVEFLSVLTNFITKVEYEERYHQEMLSFFTAAAQLEEFTGVPLLK